MTQGQLTDLGSKLWTLEQLKQMDKVSIPTTKYNDDPVNHPSHYLRGGMEVIDVIEAFVPDNYHLGNAVKYILRAGHKDEKTYIEDLRKAIFYLERAIQRATK